MTTEKAGKVVMVLGYDALTRMNWIERKMDAARDVVVEPERLAEAMTMGQETKARLMLGLWLAAYKLL